MLAENLRQEAQDLDDLIEGALGAITHVPTGSVAETVVDDLWKRMHGGDDWAEGLLRSCAREGMRRRIYQRKKSEKVSISTSKGKVLHVAAYIGVDVPTPNGKIVHQLRLFWDLTWEDFKIASDRLTQQSRTINRDIEAYAEVRKLRARFPDTKTVMEACRLAGINPREFSLEKLSS